MYPFVRVVHSAIPLYYKAHNTPKLERTKIQQVEHKIK